MEPRRGQALCSSHLHRCILLVFMDNGSTFVLYLVCSTEETGLPRIYICAFRKA
ncbi:hypothetical protein KC19_12G139200 [Ceratodon purpureus]|uniref:Uncharacterized protein n=1 Tax=Ceratodon purpureus TaxID=3225 RepID=A0A8T0GAL1_CERPU|nr:hypothetical protein KC19_12G139200 [Ceratodon purpureus]